MTKKIYALLFATGITVSGYAQRFLTEVFPSVTKTSGIIYANNISVISGAPVAQDLKMDIYEPAGAVDTMTKRPLFIFLHTGSYLPAIYNQTPTGSMNDSTAVEICTRMAKRGYVVANMDYRLGWNPAGSTVDIRRATLLRAVYRSIQDARSCVRYFKANAGAANTYKIDSTKILMGGQGTGGYVASNYIYLKDPAQITLPKFISSSTDAGNDLTAGQPYIDMAKYGDYDGYGGIPQLNNPNNNPGHTTNIAFAFNMGGAVGDSSWVTAGAAPIVGFHVTTDPFAPYLNGIVFVPGNPPQSVVDVSGSGYIVPRSVALGNNDCFKNNNFSDPFTVRANAINGGAEGLFPFILPGPQAGPWEWFDSVAVVNQAAASPGLTAANGTAAYNNGKLTNPNMSKAKAMAYIDTIMGYLNPRVVMCMGLAPNSIKSTSLAGQLDLFPNPATAEVMLTTPASIKINAVVITDVTGRLVATYGNLHTNKLSIPTANLRSGLYMVNIETDKGRTTKKLMVQ